MWNKLLIVIRREVIVVVGVNLGVVVVRRLHLRVVVVMSYEKYHMINKRCYW